MFIAEGTNADRGEAEFNIYCSALDASITRQQPILLELYFNLLIIKLFFRLQ